MFIGFILKTTETTQGELKINIKYFNQYKERYKLAKSGAFTPNSSKDDEYFKKIDFVKTHRASTVDKNVFIARDVMDLYFYSKDQIPLIPFDF